MKQSLLVAALIALALSACKKEEPAPAAADSTPVVTAPADSAPAAADASAPAADASAPAADASAPAADASAAK